MIFFPTKLDLDLNLAKYEVTLPWFWRNLLYFGVCLIISSFIFSLWDKFGPTLILVTNEQKIEKTYLFCIASSVRTFSMVAINENADAPPFWKSSPNPSDVDGAVIGICCWIVASADVDASSIEAILLIDSDRCSSSYSNCWYVGGGLSGINGIWLPRRAERIEKSSPKPDDAMAHSIASFGMSWPFMKSSGMRASVDESRRLLHEARLEWQRQCIRWMLKKKTFNFQTLIKNSIVCQHRHVDSIFCLGIVRFPHTNWWLHHILAVPHKLVVLQVLANRFHHQYSMRLQTKAPVRNYI